MYAWLVLVMVCGPWRAGLLRPVWQSTGFRYCLFCARGCVCVCVCEYVRVRLGAVRHGAVCTQSTVTHHSQTRGSCTCPPASAHRQRTSRSYCSAPANGMPSVHRALQCAQSGRTGRVGKKGGQGAERAPPTGTQTPVLHRSRPSQRPVRALALPIALHLSCLICGHRPLHSPTALGGGGYMGGHLV